MRPAQFTLRRALLAMSCFAAACGIVSLIFARRQAHGPDAYSVVLPLLVSAPLYSGLAFAGVGVLFGRTIAGFACGCFLALLVVAILVMIISLFAHGG
jgi:hypothetical protein